MGMATAKLTSKWQVTIPKSIREGLGLPEHGELLFVLEGDTARLVSIGRRSLEELAGSMPATSPWPGMAAAREAYRRKMSANAETNNE